MANMIMNVSETVCQLIHHFPGKQGLAINLPWPALKSKQRMCIELFDINNPFTVVQAKSLCHGCV